MLSAKGLHQENMKPEKHLREVRIRNQPSFRSKQIDQGYKREKGEKTFNRISENIF